MGQIQNGCPSKRKCISSGLSSIRRCCKRARKKKKTEQCKRSKKIRKGNVSSESPIHTGTEQCAEDARMSIDYLGMSNGRDNTFKVNEEIITNCSEVEKINQSKLVDELKMNNLSYQQNFGRKITDKSFCTEANSLNTRKKILGNPNPIVFSRRRRKTTIQRYLDNDQEILQSRETCSFEDDPKKDIDNNDAPNIGNYKENYNNSEPVWSNCSTDILTIRESKNENKNILNDDVEVPKLEKLNDYRNKGEKCNPTNKCRIKNNKNETDTFLQIDRKNRIQILRELGGSLNINSNPYWPPLKRNSVCKLHEWQTKNSLKGIQ